MDYVMNPERLTKPLIRKSGVKKDPNGAYKFSDISKLFRRHPGKRLWKQRHQNSLKF